MADLFAPRKILTAHLQTLVERGVLRYVGQHHELEQVFDGQPAHTWALTSPSTNTATSAYRRATRK